MNIPENQDVCPELLHMLRLQQHEYINHLQVLYSMIQMKRLETAQQYIEALAKDKDLSGIILQHVRCSACRLAKDKLD